MLAQLLILTAVLSMTPVVASAAEIDTVTEQTTGPVSDLPDSMDFVEAHPQDSPSERGFVVRKPDGRSSLCIRESIRMNSGYDFNGLLGKTTFSTVDIPTSGGGPGETSFFMQASQTRFGFDIEQATPVGEGFIRLEMDFRGAGNTARLRHGY